MKVTYQRQRVIAWLGPERGDCPRTRPDQGWTRRTPHALRPSRPVLGRVHGSASGGATWNRRPPPLPENVSRHEFGRQRIAMRPSHLAERAHEAAPLHGCRSPRTFLDRRSRACVHLVELDVARDMDEPLEIENPRGLEPPFPEVAGDAVLPVPHPGARLLEQAVEESEAAEIRPRAGDADRTREYRTDLSGGRRSIRRDPLLPTHATVLQERGPALGDLAIRPLRHDVRADRKEQVDVIAHDSEGNDIDRHPAREELKACHDPRAARRILDQGLPTNAARDAVIDTGRTGIDDVASTTSHEPNLHPAEPPPRKRCTKFLAILALGVGSGTRTGKEDEARSNLKGSGREAGCFARHSSWVPCLSQFACHQSARVACLSQFAPVREFAHSSRFARQFALRDPSRRARPRGRPRRRHPCCSRRGSG